MKSLTNLFGKDKKDQVGLLQKHGAALGLDERSSSIIIAGMDETVMPMCMGADFTGDEEACDDFLLQMFAIDRSGSMDIVENEVNEGVNDIIIPGLLGGAADQVGAIRLNGVMFDDEIEPLFGTNEWQPLAQGFPRINLRARNSTALNKAVLAAATSLTNHAVKVKDITGTDPRCVLTVLSDGANNMPPRDAREVHDVLSKLKPELFTLVFIGFQTREPVDFQKIAREMGFRDIIDLKRKPGETDDDLRRKMRHLMQVYSTALVRASTSKVASLPDATGSTGFWNQGPQQP